MRDPGNKVVLWTAVCEQIWPVPNSRSMLKIEEAGEQRERSRKENEGADLGVVSRKPRKLFGPVKPVQNLESCEYKAALVTYSKDEGRFPSHKMFRAYTLLRFRYR